MGGRGTHGNDSIGGEKVAYEFEVPAFLQDCDVDALHAKMLAELPDDIDQTEGGFVWDFTRPTAVQAAELLQFYIPETLKLMFPQWSTGAFLDYLAKSAQTKRKDAVYAVAVLEITGTPAAVIPTGTVFATEAVNGNPSLEFAAMENCILNSEGKGTVTVRAAEPGKESNVNPGTIVLMSEPLEGITGITNPEKASGGAPEESDDELRERIMEADASEETSYIGNVSDYKRWAKEVDGVGEAIVIDEWAGPETVKIVCMDQNGEAANQIILNNVYEHIMSPDNPADRLAPPNVILTVAPPTMVNVTYTFDVKIADGYDLSAVKENFRKRLDAYYKTVSNDKAVMYNKAHAELTATPGVADFVGFLMNGSTENIPIAQDEYPYTAEILIEQEGQVDS